VSFGDALNPITLVPRRACKDPMKKFPFVQAIDQDESTIMARLVRGFFQKAKFDISDEEVTDGESICKHPGTASL